MHIAGDIGMLSSSCEFDRHIGMLTSSCEFTVCPPPKRRFWQAEQHLSECVSREALFNDSYPKSSTHTLEKCIENALGKILFGLAKFTFWRVELDTSTSREFDRHIRVLSSLTRVS
jgi:hypothetical protein